MNNSTMKKVHEGSKIRFEYQGIIFNEKRTKISQMLLVRLWGALISTTEHLSQSMAVCAVAVHTRATREVEFELFKF